MPTNLNKYISKEYQAVIKVAAPAAVSKNITNASWATGVLTLTSTAHGFLPNDTVVISGLDNPELDGTYSIVAATDNTFGVPLVANPGALTDVSGTVAFANAKSGFIGQPVSGGTSSTTGIGKNIYSTGSEDYLVVDSLAGTGAAVFVDGETITGRNATVLVDTVAGNASDILFTSKGIERVTVNGSRTISEVLVAIKDFANKQAA